MPEEKTILNPPGQGDDSRDAFARLTAEISDMQEFEDLRAADRRLFEVFLEFWNQNVYSKFAYITQSNDMAGAARCLDLVGSVRKIIAGYAATGGHTKHPPSAAYPNYVLYAQKYEYFEAMAARMIPLSKDELKRFSANLYDLTEMMDGNDAAYKASPAAPPVNIAFSRAEPAAPAAPKTAENKAKAPELRPATAEEATDISSRLHGGDAEAPRDSSGTKDNDPGCYAAIAGTFVGMLLGGGFGAMTGLVAGLTIGSIISSANSGAYSEIPGAIIAGGAVISAMIGGYLSGFGGAILFGIIGLIVFGRISDSVEDFLKKYSGAEKKKAGSLPAREPRRDEPAKTAETAKTPQEPAPEAVEARAPQAFDEDEAPVDIGRIQVRKKINRAASKRASEEARKKKKKEKEKEKDNARSRAGAGTCEKEGSPLIDSRAAVNARIEKLFGEDKGAAKKKTVKKGLPTAEERAVVAGSIGLVISCYAAVLSDSFAFGLAMALVTFFIIVYLFPDVTRSGGKK